MLYEYAAPVSHEGWLTPEERHQMSAQNRGAAADRHQSAVYTAEKSAPVIPTVTTKPAKRKKKTRHAAAAPMPQTRPMTREERERAEMLERMQQTEQNRMQAMQRQAIIPDAELYGEYTEAEQIPQKTAEQILAEKKAEEHARMLERMRQTEQNRMRAQGGNAGAADDVPMTDNADAKPDERVREQTAPETDDRYEYQDEYDSERTHAGWVARRFLQRSFAPRGGFYISFGSMVSGSSALQAEAEPIQTPEQPEVGYLNEQDLTPDAEHARALDLASRTAASQTGRRKVSGGRYSEYGSANTYQRRITTGGAVIIGLLTVLLIGCVIYGKVQTNEIYTSLAELQAEYDDITAQNVSMRSEMEGKMTVKNIEEYAENVLGLRQLDQSQIEYVQIQTEDEVVISEPEENLIVTINDYLNSIWEFLRGA